MRRPFAKASGALIAAGPMPIAVASWLHGPAAWQPLSWITVAAVFATVCLTAGGLVIHRKPGPGRTLAVWGMAASLLLMGQPLMRSPALALLVLLGLTAVLSGLWTPLSLLSGMLARHSLDEARARGASLVAPALWLVASLADRTGDVPGLAAVAVSFLSAALFTGRWLVRHWTEHRVRAGALLAAAALVAAGVALAWGNWAMCLNAAMLLPITAVLALPLSPNPALDHVDWWAPVLDHPARFLVVTFFAMCVLGTVLLALPVSAASGTSIGLAGAAFTAVSAVCVTGLAVLDTPVDFSVEGQVIILVLIQLGGLGIMTFSTAALRLFGRRLGLRHEGMVAGLMSARDRSRLFQSTRRLITFTLAVEGAGAALLAALFWRHGDHALAALWRGLFTAVSAFCNAGFALQSASLVPYQESPAVLHVIGLLIIGGALSPAAAVALPGLIRGPRPCIPAQIKIALVTTALLLVAGFLLILAMEWHNTLAHLSVGDRLHNAWFQSVTLRTAGFNSIDLAQVRPATLSLMMVWMFIGGNPGSTAGGIKTSTAAVLALAVTAAIRGRQNATAFKRSISHKTVYRAAAITTVGAAAVFVALLAVQLTQSMSTRLAIFEVVSALGTVGLTIGGTGALDGVGQAIIILCMFMGRIGPLTLFMFLSNRVERDGWKRPEEDIEVG